MESGRLLTVLHDLYNEDDQIDALLKELVGLLGKSNEPTIGDQISQKTNELFTLLDSSNTNSYSVSNQKILKDIGGDIYFGSKAKSHIQQILGQDGFNIAGIVAKLNEYIKGRDTFNEVANDTESNLEELKISAIFPEDDKYEIGVIIPDKEDFAEIPKIEKQLHNWNFVFKTIGEITRKDTSNCKIKYLNNGSLQFVSEHPMETAIIVSYIIEKISKIYINVQKIRFHRQALVELKAPKNETVQIEEHEKKEIENEISKTVTEIFKDHGKQIEKGRKKELKTAMKTSIKFIAKSIDNGIEVEVITPYLEEPDPIADTATDEEKIEFNEKTEKINQQREKIAIIEKSANTLKQITDAGKGVMKLLSGGENLDEEIDDDSTDANEE